MEKPFHAYHGTDPYLFVSYAHQDQGTAYREMTWLYEAGFNIWYDEGIEVGSVWRESVADALADASGCLFLLTKNSSISDNCLREIHFALEEDIKVYAVRFDDTRLSRQLKFTLSDRQALVRGDYDEPTYRKLLIEALTNITVRNPERILERPGSKARYRTEIPLLCVNPFSCMANDEELTFFCRNLATDISRCMFSSSYYVTEGQLSDVDLKPEEVGRKHRAQYVLSGTLVRVGDKIRASVRVSETHHGTQVWAGNFDPDGDNIPDIIAAIAAEIAAGVSFTFYQYELERLKDVPEDDLDAWGLSIKSMSTLVRDAESAATCIRQGRLAVERDGEFAEAHANLADAIVSMIIAMFSENVDQDTSEALAHCDKALMLNKDSVFVLNRCSRVHRVLGNASLALQLARRVDSLTIGEFTYTLYPALIINGLSDEVVSHASNNSRATHSWVSDACVLLGDFDEAENWIRTSIARSPGSYMGWMRLANILGHRDQLDEARDVLSKVKGVSPTNWTPAVYERSLQLNWRDDAQFVDPLFAGIAKLS